MRVAEVMTTGVAVIGPDASLREAARKMDELNVGALPVLDGQRLVGVITDRDITVRATAAGEPPQTTRVDEIMTEDVRWCTPDEPIEAVVEAMGALQVRRMPVLDETGALVGIVSLGDLADDEVPGAAEALERISAPSEPDRSGTPTTRAVAETRGGPARPNDELQEEINQRLEEIGYDPAAFDVSADAGSVALAGTVESFPEKRRIEECVGAVTGVRNVENRLRIRQASPRRS